MTWIDWIILKGHLLNRDGFYVKWWLVTLAQNFFISIDGDYIIMCMCHVNMTFDAPYAKNKKWHACGLTAYDSYRIWTRLFIHLLFRKLQK